jgi:peptidoglycan/LPS O-acetylase OafA/YrhL
LSVKTLNNFDIIRLFAATQVCLSHATAHFGLHNSFFNFFLGLFPGVPIFFFVSGFLIYGSYEKSKENISPNLNFFMKRFLRLYPALWLCFVLSLFSIWQSGYFSRLDLNPAELTAWIISQVTFFQFYNPDFMREYGVGVLNGSLWTISIEIQFYLLTPLLFILLNQNSKKMIVSLLILLVFLNVFNAQLHERANIYQKLFNVSFLPWFYMFILGSLTYKYSYLLKKRIKKLSFIYLILFYVIIYFLTKSVGWGSGLNPVAFVILIILIIKSAYTAPHFSDSILKGNDFSYGIYILHMPIINYLIYLNVKNVNGVVITLLATSFLAILFWFFVEKKSLNYKKNSLRKA